MCELAQGKLAPKLTIPCRADTFFQDRSWPCLEFKSLADAVTPDAGPKRVCEIGCGTGSVGLPLTRTSLAILIASLQTAYPLLALSNNPELYIHCLDYSKKAIDLVKKNPAYDESKICGEVWSVCDPAGLSPRVEPGSIDIATLIVSPLGEALLDRFDITRPSSAFPPYIPTSGRKQSRTYGLC